VPVKGGTTKSNTTALRVIGWSTNWYGVEARTINGEAALLANAQNGIGVWAFSSTLSGVNGLTGNYGPTIPKFHEYRRRLRHIGCAKRRDWDIE
jgi:hypothetical protein